MARDVVLYTGSFPDAQTEVVTLGGRVTHQFTPVVFVANVPDDFDVNALTSSQTVAPATLDPASQLSVDAWNRAHSAERSLTRDVSKEGLSWDTPGMQPPEYLNETALAERGEGIERSTGTPTSLYLVGSVAVGVVIVSGPGTLAFTAAEQQHVLAEIQLGLNFLANAEPRANLSFVYDIRLIGVTVAAGPTTSYESAEAPWRDAALRSMGFAANRSGSVQYVQNLQSGRGTRWAYVAYFTKYPLHHFAYAVDEKLCMEYANDGWGPDQISRVFAHESCHIFGAADEYGSCSCGVSGYLGVANKNCVNCPGPRVPCLMDANTFELCNASRGQIGWDARLFPAVPIQGSTVAHTPGSVARNANQLDLFITGNDGCVYTSWWTGGATDWTGIGNRWRNVGGIFPPKAPVSVVARNPSQLDLFITGNDGCVYTSWWTGGATDWTGIGNRWRNIGGLFPVGAPVSVVARNPNQLDLFITGNDGCVYTSWWTGGATDWTGIGNRWRNIGGFFPVGAPVTVIARNPNQLDLFITGNDGCVYTSWWTGGATDWTGIGNRWRNIGGVFPVGAPVSVVARNPNQLDLFVTGNDGCVYTSWWTGGATDWTGIGNRWRNIGGVFPVGRPVSAIARNPNQLDLFITGNDGCVYTSWWTGGATDWTGIGNRWRNIGGVFPVRAPVSVLARNPNQLDLFITGNDGCVYTSWWTGGATDWTGIGNRWRNIGGIFPVPS